MLTPNTPQRSPRRTLIAYSILVIGLAVSARLILGGLSGGWMVQPESIQVDQETVPSTILTSLHPDPESMAKPSTRPIESIRVGDRVLARNPEIDDQERMQWQEPNWEDWVCLKLQLPLGPSAGSEDSGVLDIVLLRPESWFLEQLGFIYEPSDLPIPSHSELVLLSSPQFDAVHSIPLAPETQWERIVEAVGTKLESIGSELVGLTVEIDLPEMGAVGTTIVTDIQPCPAIRAGEGQVVTATFSHPPTSKILDVSFEGSNATIGVTDNHPFWSVDRGEFLPVGEMKLGENILTYHGATQRLTAVVPRPTSELVYNIEVYGEHVYYVGDQGVLVHNAYLTKAIGHSRGNLGSHLDTMGQRVSRTSRVGLAGDHVLPKQVIAEALAKAGVRTNSKLYKQVIAFQDSAVNLRLMDTRTNSSKGARMALDWMKTPIGSQMPRKYIRKMLSKQYNNAQEINRMLNKNKTGPAVDYFAEFFGR